MPAFEFRGKVYDNPVELAIELIGGKWKMPIPWRLQERTWRYSELKRGLGLITHKMLTQQLRELEGDGLITRTVPAVMPPRVDYDITEFGRSSVPIIELPRTWGEQARRRKRHLVMLICLGVSAALAAGTCRASAAVSSVERRMSAAVDRGVPAALGLLERAVNMNSGTLNFVGVRETARIFEPEFVRLGFDVTWIPGEPWNRAGHLIARRHPANARLRVLLIGHLDTVFEADSPFQRYERISETRAKGPGVIDMKGGNVVALLALEALRAAGRLDQVALTVVLTGDEEKSGAPLELARRELRVAAKWADVAIGFEDGDGDPRTAVVSRRGSSGWTLVTKGRPFHSSQIFRESAGSGAIYEAARILSAFHDSLSAEDLLTANPGFLVGGTAITHDLTQSRGTAFGKSNVIAESTFVAGDLRALSRVQLERARAAMGRITARNLRHTRAELTFDEGYPPLSPSDGNRRLLARFDEVSRDLGFGPVTAVDPAKAGAADISFTEGFVSMALDGVGLMGEGGHTVNETADLTTLPMNAKRVAVLLSRLIDAGPPRD